MKHFIVKVLVFLSILGFYFSVNSIINYLFYSRQPPPVIGKRILIAGDSHSQTSINPFCFSSAANISQSAEPLLLSYWKLKKIFEKNNPDTVIFGFSPHNISKFNDLKFSNSFSRSIFKVSYPIERFSELKNKISIDYYSFYKTLFKEIAFYPKFDHINYIGEYSNSTRSEISIENSRIKTHFYLKKEEYKVSKIAISYLDSIVSLCSLKSIVLVLVNSPVHKTYFDNIPLSFIEGFKKIQNNYANKCLIIDGSPETYPDSLFLDSDHLNEYGATKFTNEIIYKLNQIK